MFTSMMRRALYADDSTLNLDFTTGVLDSRLTFTRSSTTATYIDSNGYVASASTDVPRFDHDPTTLAPRGLLIEAQATNLLNWSESFATTGGTNNNWGYTDISDVGGKADPANGTTAIELEALNANATLISSAAIGTSAARTFSVWLRRVSGTGNIQYTQNNGTNWTTQAITSTWTRYSFTHTVDHQVGIRIVTSGDAIEMWGAQLEEGGASSYIPTGASQVTRNSDICYLANTDYGFTTTGGTYFVEWERGEYDNPNVAGTSCFPFSTDYASGRWLAIFTSPGGTTTSAGSWSGQVNQNSTAVAGRNRAAVSYAGWNAPTTLTLSANGSSPTSNASMTLGTTPTYLMIGAASSSAPYNGGGLRDILGNRVRRLKYWPFVLPSATLQSITVNTP